MAPELESAWLKVARTEEQREAFDQELDVFQQSHPCAIRSDLDPNTGEKVWSVDGEPPVIPLRFSMLVGEILFHFRSALDHLAWQLVLANGQTPTTHTAFPIFDDATAFSNRGRQRLEGMSPASQTAIEELQPYRRGNPYRDHLLSTLNSLNNIDKHRHLNLLVVGSEGGFWPTAVPVSEVRIFVHYGPIERGTVLARYPREYVDMQFKPAFDVAFGEGGTGKLQTIGYVIIGIRGVVEDILTQFERDFF